jgi:mannose-6-phosphate isomerase
MVAERASAQFVRKPWGSADLRPWNDVNRDGVLIGELWFQRCDKLAPASTLLLKLLFTTRPLSIQVHPDDAFARSIGLANGKTEAWYILSAETGAKVAIGLKNPLSSAQLRAAIADGSIVSMMQWREVHAGDTCFVPAGTIHTIGAGIVLAEIQQQSDTTFRIFDYENERELHIDNAVTVADTMPARPQPPPEKLSDNRTVLLSNPHFVLEKISLPPGSRWTLCAARETWLLPIGGDGRVGSTQVTRGDAMFFESEQLDILVGQDGLDGLLAYTGPDRETGLLERVGDLTSANVTGVPRVALEQSSKNLDRRLEAQT